MNFYRVLRNNKELGPFSLEEVKKMGLQSSDLVWVDGQSAAWRFPDEVPGLLSQIENNNPKTEEEAPQLKDSFDIKPKKRYRLTADHRMVEITEEEAQKSDLPRIEEQPPAPKTTIITPAVTENKVEDDGVVPFQDIPFSKKTAVSTTEDADDFPLEPELDSRKTGQESIVPFQDEPFSKKATNTTIEDTSFPLEPAFDSKNKTERPVEDFVDIDSNRKEEMSSGSNTPSNTGAFVLVGLLFLVTIGFFGYRWYQDQNEPKTVDATNTADSVRTEPVVGNKASGFANSQSIAMNDDTLGQHERLAQRKVQDSIKRLEVAKAKLAAREKAKADSIQNALLAQTTDNPANPDATTPEKNKTGNKDSLKENKVNKIRSTEDIGKYVRVGVVQPKNQTNGVSGVKLVVHNINNRNLAKVHINVMYYDNNGAIIKKSDIIAPNITVGNSVTVPVADNTSASYVSYKVTGLLGDHVNLQAK